MWSVYFQYVVT